jgi:ribosomal protein S12 methylthiotransferase
MRGKHVSIPIEQLVTQAQNLAKNGTKELMIIAQDSTYYGLDLYKKRNLAELLERLSDVEGIEWLRLHYAFPAGFPEDILDVIANNPKVCKYIDMPLQHISDAMLKAMRRGTTKQKTIDLVNKIRDKVPGISLRTTLISGYPGETDEDFEQMLEWVKATRFDRLGIFSYSHEENTHAYQFDDNIPQEVKDERCEIIMDAQAAISFELNEAKVGQTFKVLFDRKEGDYFIGRTEFDSPEVDNEVLVNAKDNFVRIGDFANVQITHAEAFDLIGKVVS